jgi:hypothetical protein
MEWIEEIRKDFLNWLNSLVKCPVQKKGRIIILRKETINESHLINYYK